MTEVIRKAVYPLAIFLLAFSCRIIPGPRTVDDAYITFRYAHNLLAGEGFVYNPGDAVLGTTTPFYTLLMAGLGVFTGGPSAPFPEIAMVVNAFADGLTCLVLWTIGRRLGSRFGAMGASLVWAVAPFSVTFAIGGLETSVFVLFLCTLALAYLGGYYTTSALLAGLAVLTRPDALLLVIPLALDRAHSAIRGASPRIGPREILALVLPVLAWGIFATFYFGNPLSHSLAAKSLAYRLTDTAALVRLVQHYATPFLEQLTFGTRWIAIGLILFPFLNLIGIRQSVRADPRSWPMMAYPWVYLAAFSLANPLIFRWYLTPPLPFYILAILIGAESLLAGLLQRLPQTGPSATVSSRRSLSTGVIILFTVLIPVRLSLQDWSVRPDHGNSRPAPGMAWYQLELYYKEAADYLEPLLQEKSVLAASDVGVLGYFTSSQILDTVGLNSPVALEYYPIDPEYYVINLATSPDLLAETRPDYVVLLEVYGREGVFKDERFRQSYTLINKIPTDIYGSDGMLIFSRNDLIGGSAPKNSS